MKAEEAPERSGVRKDGYDGISIGLGNQLWDHWKVGMLWNDNGMIWNVCMQVGE